VLHSSASSLTVAVSHSFLRGPALLRAAIRGKWRVSWVAGTGSNCGTVYTVYAYAYCVLVLIPDSVYVLVLSYYVLILILRILGIDTTPTCVPQSLPMDIIFTGKTNIEKD
jgi:hypothetical protein